MLKIKVYLNYFIGIYSSFPVRLFGPFKSQIFSVPSSVVLFLHDLSIYLCTRRDAGAALEFG